MVLDTSPGMKQQDIWTTRFDMLRMNEIPVGCLNRGRYTNIKFEGFENQRAVDLLTAPTPQVSTGPAEGLLETLNRVTDYHMKLGIVGMGLVGGLVLTPQALRIDLRLTSGKCSEMEKFGPDVLRQVEVFSINHGIRWSNKDPIVTQKTATGFIWRQGNIQVAIHNDPSIPAWTEDCIDPDYHGAFNTLNRLNILFAASGLYGIGDCPDGAYNDGVGIARNLMENKDQVPVMRNAAFGQIEAMFQNISDTAMSPEKKLSAINEAKQKVSEHYDRILRGQLSLPLAN